MSLYNYTKRECQFGEFSETQKGGYTIKKAEDLNSPWYYIYQNRKILLYLDQYGPVKMQHQPPSGVLPFKREMGETQSKWFFWIQSDDVNGGYWFSNFKRPLSQYIQNDGEYTVNWTPAKANYMLNFDNLLVSTEIFVPVDKATVCMKTTIKNTGSKKLNLQVAPAVFPYMNVSQMEAWDLPKWYLSSQAVINDDKLSVIGRMSTPSMIKENNRVLTLNVDYESDAMLELDLNLHCGSGSFFAPDAVFFNKTYSNKMSDCKTPVSMGGEDSVYAFKYSLCLDAGEQKTYTEVMTVQEGITYSEEENKYDSIYFDEKAYSIEVKKAEDFYDDMFAKRKFTSSNSMLNDFVNYFTPLQMYWVCSLDRGWPSCMRGVRDASQDFVGMIEIDPSWTKETICSIAEHQRKSDGWFPRQISTISRQAPHDMREYCDGGAFYLELIHHYLTYTRDFDLLDEKVYWLDSDEKSTILDHIIKAVQYYICEDNIGEHGLTKVWHGDWWDVMDKIGLEGRGESVTVSAQNIFNLKNLSDMFKHLVEIGRLDKEYLKLSDIYLSKREDFKNALNKYAYNSKGFYNGYFNDNGKWLLSQEDPDGAERMYLVSNAWAIISGAADEEKKKSVLENVNRLCKGVIGYNTKSSGYAVYVDKAGRVGNGTSPGTSPYNHAQSFLVRAACVAGNPDLAYDASRYIYPIEEKYAPVAKTGAPPFSIVNAYSASRRFLHRACFQYLSGTVSYVLRSFYNFFLGITYCYDGLMIKPALPKAFGDVSAEFIYLGKKLKLECHFTDGKSNEITLDGKTWTVKRHSEEENKEFAFFYDESLKDGSIIRICY